MGQTRQKNLGLLLSRPRFIVHELSLMHYNLSFEVLHDDNWHEGFMRLRTRLYICVGRTIGGKTELAQYMMQKIDNIFLFL